MLLSVKFCSRKLANFSSLLTMKYYTITDSFRWSHHLFVCNAWIKGNINMAELKEISQQAFLVFQDVFSVTLFVFQDVFKTCFQYVLLKCLQDAFKTSCNYVFKTSSRRLGRQKNVTLKTSSVRLHQDECLLGCV